MNLYTNINTLKWFNFFTDFTFYSPIAILYFTQVSGSFVLGMSVFSVIMASSAIFEVPTGVFSDRIGRRKTLILGAIAYASCAVFFAIGISYWFLFIGALFAGLGRSFYSGNNNALLYDTLLEHNKEDKYHEYLGKVSSMFQIALAISALLGSFIAAWSFSLVMWLSVIPQIICIFLAFKIIEPKVHGRKIEENIYAHLKIATKAFLRNKKLRLISISDILRFGIGESSFAFNSAFVALLVPVWAIGLIKMLTYTGGAISYRYSGKMIDKLGAVRLLFIASIYNRTVNFIALLFPTVLSPFLMSTTSLWFGAANVSTSTLMQKEYTKEQRATMDSFNSLGGSIFYAIFAILLGFLADKYGVITALIFVQFASLIVLGIYWKLFRSSK